MAKFEVFQANGVRLATLNAVSATDAAAKAASIARAQGERALASDFTARKLVPEFCPKTRSGEVCVKRQAHLGPCVFNGY